MHARHLFCFTSVAILSSASAPAADQLRFGKAPAWTVSHPIPSAGDADGSAPMVFLLSDQQLRFEPGKVVSYMQSAVKIQSSHGLSAGNISLPWDPATQTVTVNKLEIRRGTQVIDVLASGQTFTTIRRESNLERAMFDGMLTATIQPEGLQEGDTILLATTTEYSDPLLKGHTAARFAMWNGVPVKAVYSRLDWPETMKLVTRLTSDLPSGRIAAANGRRSLELTATDIQPITPPASAPARFRIGRLGEASDFQSWAEVAELMLPLYRDAAVIPATGPLRDEVTKISAASRDPKERAAKALEVAQSRVRYVALLMGQGGYVPAPAETTWSRRYGDCKAKTALLLALLHALDIDAEPVLVNVDGGDAVADRLPTPSQFNHVLVRARIAGKEYWLDGTRSGDSGIDDIPVPNIGWGLPISAGAKLVKIIPAPFEFPATETVIDMDATGGVRAPVPTTIEILYRGDVARSINQAYTAATAAQMDEWLRQEWKKNYDFVTIASSGFKFDKVKGELRQSVKGEVKMEWRDGWFTVPGSSLAYDPDFERASGPHQQAPFATSYPDFEVSRVKIRLPERFLAAQKSAPPQVKEVLGGVAYDRSVTFAGDVLTLQTSERTMAPELPYREALAAKARIKALWQNDVYLRLSDNYIATKADLAALGSMEISSGADHFARGVTYLNARKYDEAIADFLKSVAADPKDPWSVANLAMARVWKRQFAEAAKDIAAAEALDPDNQVLLRAKGLLASMQGDHARAAETFGRAVTKDPKDSFSLFQRVGPLLVIRDFEGAEETVNAIEAIAPDNPAIGPMRVQIAMARGDPKAAIVVMNKALERKPSDPGILAARAKIYSDLGEYAKALADSERALVGSTDKPNVRLLRSNVYRNLGDRNKAIEEAALMMRESPQSDFAQVAAARVYASFGLHDESMKAFARALEIKPASYIYVNRAQSRPSSDKAGKRSDFAAALKLDATDVDALLGTADQLAKEGQQNEALAYYDRALKADPHQKEFEVGRALLLAKMGRAEEAEKAIAGYRKGLTLAGEFNNLCWAKATAGVMLESAIKDCEEALRMAPKAPAYLDSLGLALLRSGRIEEALTTYDRALTSRPFSSSLMGRALTYAAKGDSTRAAADALAARKMDEGVEDRYAGYGLRLSDERKLTSQ